MDTKVALVTGASSGIGLEIAHTLLGRGYSIAAAPRTASKQPALADATRFVAVDGDVADERTAARAVEAARTTFGKLNLLVNNAGIFIAKRFTDYTADDYAKLLATNLAGFFHMTQHALRAMEGRLPGHIVNIGTTLSSQPVAGVPSALPILIKGGIEAATVAKPSESLSSTRRLHGNTSPESIPSAGRSAATLTRDVRASSGLWRTPLKRV